MAHCRELILALRGASRQPPYNEPKEWGRGLPETATTEYLPKVYWLPGRGPLTCALSLDVDPLYPDGREVFSLVDVAFAASQIVVLCLSRKREVGSDRLGRTGQVLAKLVRTDGPAIFRDIDDRDGGLGWVDVPGIGKLMWRNEAGNGSLEAVR